MIVRAEELVDEISKEKKLYRIAMESYQSEKKFGFGESVSVVDSEYL